MSNLRQKLQTLFIVMLLGIVTAAAQEIRYVKIGGDDTKDGRSWANAKANIQAAINDLVTNNLTGEVWVAVGKYHPTETTDASSSPYYKSFKIPAGITVRGGFKSGLEGQSKEGVNTIETRPMKNDKNFGKTSASGTLDGESSNGGVYYWGDDPHSVYQTILCGDVSSTKQVEFKWDATKEQFQTTFYGNSYHVVWFAMGGFDDNGRALPLSKPAKLEGCVIEGGHAYTRDALSPHPHVGYGGGIYMVANSFVYNCEVRHCDASRNGGGIYMDGGGIVRRTYVHDCQALGLGTDFGLGGGICEDGAKHNSKANPVVVAQSVVTNCVGRMGGGMALVADQTVGKNKYTVVVNSSVVNNNTAQVEAGGVYTYKGGGLASTTVVNNKCIGSGITQNGVITGRAGGVYSRDASYIGNTVIWGNKCEANKDMQYANSRSSLADDEKSKFLHSALSNADVVDWSTTERLNVVSLETENSTETSSKSNKGYALFKKPTPATKTVDEKEVSVAGYYPEAVTGTDWNWSVYSESALTYAGINTADLDKEGLTPAPTGKQYDMQFGQFNSRPTIGALISEVPTIAPNTEVANKQRYFVDPNFIYSKNNTGNNGESWTHPARFLGSVLDHVKNNPAGAGTEVIIYVKEGTVDNTRYNTGDDRVRTTSLEIPSNVTILGSYDATLTGEDLSRRNPVLTPTVISGKLLDDYKYNVAHLIKIDGKENITIDGFKLTFANASSELLGNDDVLGAAITLKNCYKQADRPTIHFKNIIVSNCQAERGAVVYSEKSAADFENCIFHNNSLTRIDHSGLIHGVLDSDLRFDHCDVVRNVGNASYLDEHQTVNKWTNTIFYGNMDRRLTDTNTDAGGGIGFALPAFSGTTANATGSYCMFDSKSAEFAPQFGGNDTGNKWQYDLQYAFVDGTGQGYPRFINPTKNAGVTEDGDQTYYGRATSFEPHNNNPVVNLASDATPGTDIIGITRNYGGLPDIGAVENHEAKRSEEGENAYTDGQKKYGEVLYVRDYTPATGTKIDTYDYDGANYTKNDGGKGIYRQTAAGSDKYELLDGSSWERAINGNAIYSLSGTRTYRDVNNQRVLAYKINNNGYYLDVENGTLHRVKSGTVTRKVINPETGEVEKDPITGEDVEETYDPADRATVFILCDETGKEILFNAGKTPKDGARLKDATTGEYLYLDYMYGTYTFRTSANPPADQAKATIAASSTNFTIYYKANGQTKYLSNADVIPSSTKTPWTFTDKDTKVDFGDGTLHENEVYDMETFTGLQYAVNKQNIAYKDEASLTGDKIKAKKQVWVGAGVYKRDPAVNSVANPIVDMDNENCFIIQDGVDVYGAFPKTGNPGKNERQALVSQYVHVLTERRITVASDYETILEPLTIGGSPVAVKRRVLGQPYKYNPDKGNDPNRGKDGGILYCGIDYISIVWDGFTLRNGVWDSKGLNRPNRYGGSGAAIYKNVTLKNAVVYNNLTIYSQAADGQDFRAGGIYMDGGILDAGYVINNKMEGYDASKRTQKGAAYGGGMYIYSGTVFNSVVANNYIYSKYADGAGLFIENANFFNNTIVNNKAEGTTRASSGVAIWTDPGRGTESKLTLYNCIIAGNVNTWKGESSSFGNENVCVPRAGLIELHNCLTNATEDLAKNSSWMHFIKCGEPVTDYSTIFVDYKDYDASATAFNSVNLRLKAEAERAINTGDEAPVIGGAVYNLIDYNDMDFAERIQDCNIDIGAYEFNGATSVQPQVIDNQAIYYVTPEGYGTTNANDPENAACAEKLQRVLDAAGRYKYLNPQKQVIVKVANSYDLLHPKNVDSEGHAIPEGDERYVYPSDFKYYATRTTDWTDQDVRVWSIIVPRGVEVWGGYSDIALNDDGTEYNEAGERKWDNTHNGFSFEGTDRRNITKYPTYFDSYYVNKLEKTDAHTYHVVTFSDRIFDKNGYAYTLQDFKDVTTAEQVREILERGESSVYIELLDNDESHFVHMSEALPGYTGVKGNVIMDGENPKNFGTAEAPQYASNRAVIDGIFVSGGKADASTQSYSSAVNINSYGGAALVNDYAYVRNCILTGNTATNGGALALTNNALVSGCLVMNNEATNNGGGIYVFEEGTKLSNGTTIKSLQQDGDPTMDYRMAHVLTSTIVQNMAQQGGGVWYSNSADANARFNSVAIWQNNSKGQANVYGSVHPEQPTDDETLADEYYPFAYSVIQNIRASGTNNMSTEPLNRQGVRFVKKEKDFGNEPNVDLYYMAEETSETDLEGKYSDFGYYGLTTYSILCSNGMPAVKYDELKKAIAIADDDILAKERVHAGNQFVEVGARSLAKELPKKQLMLRLFVANPEDVDTQTAGKFMRLSQKTSPTDAEEYYSQEGSSFAYPFNFLQDALDYVKEARNNTLGVTGGTAEAYDLPFEILVAKGTYWPKQDLNGGTISVWSHTFAIPEGVTIIGGFNPHGGGTGSYYGRYNKPVAEINHTSGKESVPSSKTMFIDINVEPIPTTVHQHSTNDIGRGYKSDEETVTLPDASTVTFQQWDIQDICDRRAMNDNNKNGIIEPWEFKNQTIISGNAVNGETDGVYHVMTAVADADAVGNLPTAGYVNDRSFITTPEKGYQWKEYGQQIRLNGLIITGGNGLTYLKTALDEYGKYIYYQGAGLQVDGNRYNPTVGGTPVFHNTAAYGVGYRDIPVSIVNCQFRNNIAGYGGAISTNGTLDTFASSFEQNLAVAQTEKPKTGETWITDVDPAHKGQSVTKVMYPGQGGAILATGQVSCYNTLFANNEARMGDNDTPTIDLVKHPTFRVPDENAASPTLRAAGGAIMVGSAGRYHMMNCDFVRNKANAYPVIFTMNPNSTEDEKGILEKTSTENYNQIVSTVVWGNEVNKVTSGNEYYNFASKMMVNVGKKAKGSDGKYPQYTPEFVEGNVPSSQEDLDQNWKEFVWFSAYEDGVGFTTNNKYDLRDNIIFKTGEFVNWNIKAAAAKVGAPTGWYQNCNIQIVAENEDVAGPNFGIPSVRAGYDGFMEGADWSPARINRLTDNGSGWIKQSVDNSTLKVTFDDKVASDASQEVKNQHYQGGYPVAHYDTWPEYKLWLAIGNEKYMQATSEAEENDVFINGTSLGRPQKNLPRISPDPTLGVEKAYIDIGVYEYQKQPMVKPGSEVDILWVSTEEHPENGPATGATWRTPTSDLQKAIETLLSSRNGHKKEIRLMEGEYAPINTKSIGGTNYSAFVIDTKSLNGRAITPSDFVDGTNNEKYYAQSITIKGGYSKDIIYENDPAQYKTVIRQSKKMDGANTDHLIYIADPTVRYAGTSTGIGHNNATFGSTGEAKDVRTMPIQVDGVTLINDLANENTKGSAIYYPDYDDTAASPETGVVGAHSVSVGGKVVYYANKEDMEKRQNPVDHETEFALITDEDSKTVSDTKLLVTKTIVVGSGNKSDVIDLDDPSKNPSAVYIGNKGGAALIYNSVFHSNYGMPLDAWNTINVNNTFGKNKGLVRLQDHDDVTTKSQIHNSALWMNNNNNEQFSMPNVSVVATEGDTKGDVSGDGKANFTYNSFTGGNLKYADYDKDVAAGGHVAGNNYNTGLSDINKDLANGPNFVDPENADIYARNFDIRPSVRLLNKGNGTRTPGTPDTYAGLYNTLVVKSKYDFSLASTTDKDVLSRMRIVSEGSPQKIDVGAYEFQGTLQKVLYVDPNKTHRDEATGENWDDSFGYGDLQDAVDLAGIYHMNSATKDESYVFVKGNSSTNQGKNTNETLTIRDGVTVYGSIIDGYTDWHDITEDDGEGNQVPKYRKSDGHGGWVYDIDKFIADMTFNREGVASNAASKTIVTGIKTSEYTAFDGGNTGQTPALVDGFVVTDPTPATAPVLDVTNTSKDAVIVVRNVVVADNTIDNSATGTDVNVAQISNGLIYEALFRDNKPKGNGAVLKVSNNPEGAYNGSTKTSGYAVNVTVEGKTVGADFDPANADSYVLPVDGKRGTTDVESATQIFKSITNSINSGSGPYKAGEAAPYGQITNPGISGYFYNIADPNLNYQLTETSKYIDMCEAVNPLSAIPEAANLVQFINYETDRDLLGNPRWMRNVSNADLIDRGAFETWRVDNDFVCGKWQKNSTWYGTNKGLDDAIAPHFYPHDGSVVYVMENKNLVIDPLGDHDVKATPENPGFLLVKKGANFYGNGRPVTAAYVAIERDVRKGGSIVAVPYAMNYNSTESVAKVETETHDNHDDLFLNKQNGSAAYKYSGNERMDWKYIFQATDTKCWDQVSATAANQGALFQPYQGEQWYEKLSTDNTTALLRFTGKGANLTDYIYRENGVSKDVTLTKYDDSESTNDGADYTDEKDMGWNCFGIPYLVSNYKPYLGKDGGAYTSGDHMMEIAHVLWLYYDGKVDGEGHKLTPDDTQSVNGPGGYYSINSWECATYKETGDDHSAGDVASVISVDTTNPWHVSNVNQQALWVGEGIFTQTATLQDTEALKFWLPVAPTSFQSPSSAKSVVRYYFDGTGIEETVSSDDVELVGTEYYTVDGLRIERPRRGQVVIIRNLYSNGSAKTSKMFVK